MAQLTDGTATAMSLDAREGTHPIVQEINTIDDANLAFDDDHLRKGPRRHPHARSVCGRR